MGDFYVDQTAYASEGALGADNPTTWGVPQEGDGSASSAATAGAIGSLAFSSVPTTGTISVCGASVSTTGVIGAATVAAAADALAANINATTATVSSSAAGGTPALRNLVYARGPTNGAPAGTCQIMMRVGSAALNYANNSSAAIAHTFDGTPTVTQFTGGSGGCWGFIANTATIGGSGATYAICGYGVLTTVLPFVCCSSADVTTQAQPTAGDIIHGRSDGTVINVPNNTNHNWTNFTVAPFFLLDDGTVWSGSDAGLTFTLAPASSNAFFGIGKASGRFTLAARKKDRFFVEARSWTSSGKFCLGGLTTATAAPHTTYVNINVREIAGVPAWMAMAVTNYCGATLIGCTFDFTANTRASGLPQLYGSTSQNGPIRFLDCEVKATLTSGSEPGAWLQTVIFASTVRNLLEFSGCRFSGWMSPLKLLGTVSNPRLGNIIIDNCSGVRIDSGAYVGYMGALSADFATSQFVYRSKDPGQPWLNEKQNVICDWLYGQSNWPTLSAVQKDGTPWSMRVLWTATAGSAIHSAPAVTPALVQEYREADDERTVQLEFLAPSSLTLEAHQISMSVVYTDENGVSRRESTWLNSSALTSSSAAWTLNGLTGYSKYKLTLVTAYKVMQDTQLGVQLTMHDACPSGSNAFLFVDPEFVIAAP